VSWQTAICQDCFTTIVAGGGMPPGDAVVLYNAGFWTEAARMAEVLGAYHRSPRR
jgi:hypothetical protein